MKQLCLALLGCGTAGQWLVKALQTQYIWLQQELGVVVTIMSVGTAYHGLMYRDDKLDIPTFLDLAATWQPLTAHPEGPIGRTSWRDCSSPAEMFWLRQPGPRSAMENQG